MANNGWSCEHISKPVKCIGGIIKTILVFEIIYEERCEEQNLKEGNLF